MHRALSRVQALRHQARRRNPGSSGGGGAIPAGSTSAPCPGPRPLGPALHGPLPVRAHLVLGLLLQTPPLVQGLGGGGPGPGNRLLLLGLGRQEASLAVVLTALRVALLGLAQVGLRLLLWARG